MSAVSLAVRCKLTVQMGMFALIVGEFTFVQIATKCSFVHRSLIDHVLPNDSNIPYL